MEEKRNIRAVIDAGYDLYGAESANSYNNVGWTARAVVWQGNGYAALTFYDSICKDSQDHYPYQDPIYVIEGFAAYYIPSSSFHTNTGLKHIHHQMQAMKGYGFAGDNGLVPSVINVTGTGNGNGTYKTANISMGGMRGFKYSISTMSSTWPSSAGTVETLQYPGAISIGTTS
jgi:hypothetical protein